MAISYSFLHVHGDDDMMKIEDCFVSNELFLTLEHFILQERLFNKLSFLVYNINLYALVCKQRWVFNMLIACIFSIFKFHAFGKLQFS